MSLNLSFRNRFLTRKIAAAFLLISLFSNYSLAAPEAARFLVVLAGETSQSVRFAYSTNLIGSVLFGWANNLLLFIKTKQETARISRIEIRPGGELTIRQGEPINFTAVGYDAKDIPVGGVKFEWTIADTAAGGDQSEYFLSDGTFSARTPGNFVITANAEGLQAQVKVAVEESQPFIVMQRIRDEAAVGSTAYADSLIRLGLYSTGSISSKRAYSIGAQTSQTAIAKRTAIRHKHGPSAEDPESENAESSASRFIRRPADEDGWSNNNWWMADDPNNQTGNPPGTSPDAGAGTGNFQFSAPVVSLPGRGIDISLSLNYNSRVWSKAGTTMSFDAERGYPAPGWNLGFGKMMFMGTSGGCMLIDADGTNHGYTGTISNWSSGGDSSTSFTGHTTDGTFIDYSCSESTLSGVTTMSGSSSLPNGTQVSYSTYSANGKQAFPTQIMDAQGNYINITYRNSRGPEIQTVTDTMGRVITFNYDSSTPARLISVDVPAMDNAGTRTAVRLHYKTLTLNPGWAAGITTDTNNAAPNVIDGIYYPGTNTGYWFNNSDSYSSYGMISKVIEQRAMLWSGTAGDQGTITAGTMSKQAVYDYPLTPIYTITDAPTYDTLTEQWAGMDTDPAVTNYSVNNNDYHSDGYSNSPCTTIQVTQPNGLISKQYSYRTPGAWTDGLVFADETIQMNGGTPTTVASSLASWQLGDYDSARPSFTTVIDEKSQTLKTTYTYGSNYNQVTSQKEYDYDGTTLLKETRNTYQSNSSYISRHIFSLVTSTEVYDGNNNRQSKTDYTYDGATLVADPNVTMFSVHNDPYTTAVENTGVCLNWYQPPYGSAVCTQWQIGSAYHSSTAYRGNVTQVTSYADAVTPSGAISQTKQYDITGNVVAESASCCELKTYTYTSATQYAYPTTQTRGSSDPNSTIRNTSTAVFDFNTGLVKQSTDPNGRTRTTTYDANTLRPVTSTTSTGAYTTTNYDESAMTITEEVKDASNVTAGKTIRYLNGLGLKKREDSIGPSNVTDITETKYNQLWRGLEAIAALSHR